MWLFTEHGFFSLVKKGKFWHLRARRFYDLDQICDKITPRADAVTSYPGSDYPFRAILTKSQKDSLFKVLSHVEYNNFKGRVAEIGGGPDRLHLYHQVWNLMRQIELH